MEKEKQNSHPPRKGFEFKPKKMVAGLLLGVQLITHILGGSKPAEVVKIARPPQATADIGETADEPSDSSFSYTDALNNSEQSFQEFEQHVFSQFPEVYQPQTEEERQLLSHQLSDIFHHRPIAKEPLMRKISRGILSGIAQALVGESEEDIMAASEKIDNKLNGYVQEIRKHESFFNQLGTKERRERLENIKAKISSDYQKQIRLHNGEINDPKRHPEEKRQLLAKIQREVLDPWLSEVYGLAAAQMKQSLGIELYDIQLKAAVILHKYELATSRKNDRGVIAEIKTGEGKTYVAPLPLILNSLLGEGCYLLTANDRLARRDVAEKVGCLYHDLDITVGVIASAATYGDYGAWKFSPYYQESENQSSPLQPVAKKEAYQADIKYLTVEQLGFDFMWDELRSEPEAGQSPFRYCLIDEADSSLIDRPTLPLIISGGLLSRAPLETVDKVIELAKQFGVNEYFDVFRTYRESKRALRIFSKISALSFEKAQETEEDLLKIARAESEKEFNQAKNLFLFSLTKASPAMRKPIDWRVIDLRDKYSADFVVSEKEKRAHLTEQGREKVAALFQEQLKGREKDRPMFTEYLQEVLRVAEIYLTAKYCYSRHDYFVRDDKVILIDSFTGRPLARRLGNGLHLALEFVNGVSRRTEDEISNQTTIAGILNRFTRLSGMTGTALTDKDEFQELYQCGVVGLWTNVEDKTKGSKPAYRKIKYDGKTIYVSSRGEVMFKRIDKPTIICRDDSVKWDLVIDDVKKAFFQQRPVLIGVQGAEEAEFLASRLKALRIPYLVAHAGNFEAEKEAWFVQNAGRAGNVLIATQLAGRGEDILLGGNPKEVARESFVKFVEKSEKYMRKGTLRPREFNEQQELEKARVDCAVDRGRVLENGGLLIVGTYWVEDRIRKQLNGRAGRQGEPGESRWYISCDEPDFRLFVKDRIERLLDFSKLKYLDPGNMTMLDRQLSDAQRIFKSVRLSQLAYFAEWGRFLEILRDNFDSFKDKTRMKYYVPGQQILTQMKIVILNTLWSRFIADVGEIIIPSVRVQYHHEASGHGRGYEHVFLISNLAHVFETELLPQAKRIIASSPKEVEDEFKKIQDPESIIFHVASMLNVELEKEKEKII